MAGWKSVEEIVAYRVSAKLRDEIIEIAKRPPISKDFKFREQIVTAAASAPSNISEGFDLYKHGRFSYHVGVAKASLAELENHLKDGRNRGYLDDPTCNRLEAMRLEAWRTALGLYKYLKTTEAPPASWEESPPAQG